MEDGDSWISGRNAKGKAHTSHKHLDTILDLPMGLFLDVEIDLEFQPLANALALPRTRRMALGETINSALLLST